MTLINTGSPIYLAETGKKFRLSEDWEFLSKLHGRLIVPSNYVCDLASIPQWIWWWQWGAWHLAAICHDYIYEYGYINIKKVNGSVEFKNLDRINADVIFYEVLLAVGVKKRTASLMYWAVRFFGGWYWHHD